MDLMNEFEEETGKKSYSGILDLGDWVHTYEYVKWLENMVGKLRKEIEEQCDEITVLGGMWGPM